VEEELLWAQAGEETIGDEAVRAGVWVEGDEAGEGLAGDHHRHAFALQLLLA
jgi:hypothetical protein